MNIYTKYGQEDDGLKTILIPEENKSDYDKIEAFDTISTLNLNEFGPKTNISLSLKNPDGSTYIIKTIHTFSENQISWFKAGSALNLIADQVN